METNKSTTLQRLCDLQKEFKELYEEGDSCEYEESKPSDNIDNPSHYTQGKYEVIDVIEDWGLDKDFYLANVIKYIARAEYKGKYEEDLKKAMFYLSRKIEKMSEGELDKGVCK